MKIVRSLNSLIAYTFLPLVLQRSFGISLYVDMCTYNNIDIYIYIYYKLKTLSNQYVLIKELHL